MKKILLVEDDLLFADLLEKALVTFGYQVFRAGNAKQALQHYDPQTIDLVITDLIMPDMEGMELIVTLRRRHPCVRVIAISGGGRNPPEIYLKIADRIGALRTLAKPFPLEVLRQAVSECLAAPGPEKLQQAETCAMP